MCVEFLGERRSARRVLDQMVRLKIPADVLAVMGVMNELLLILV